MSATLEITAAIDPALTAAAKSIPGDRFTRCFAPHDLSETLLAALSVAVDDGRDVFVVPAQHDKDVPGFPLQGWALEYEDAAAMKAIRYHGAEAFRVTEKSEVHRIVVLLKSEAA